MQRETITRLLFSKSRNGQCLEGGENVSHLNATDALTATGALVLAFLARWLGVDGEYFALAAAVVGFVLGFRMRGD